MRSTPTKIYLFRSLSGSASATYTNDDLGDSTDIEVGRRPRARHTPHDLNMNINLLNSDAADIETQPYDNSRQYVKAAWGYRFQLRLENRSSRSERCETNPVITVPG